MENRRKSRKSLHDVNRDLSINPIRRDNPPAKLEIDEEKKLVQEMVTSTAKFEAEIAQWEKTTQLAEPLAPMPPPLSTTPDEIEKLFEMERQLSADMENQSEQRKRENLLDMWQLQADREKENFARRLTSADTNYEAYVAQFTN